MIDKSIADEAVRLITGDRDAAYGGTTDRIVALWAAYLDAPVTHRDYYTLMALMKIGRMEGTHSRDTYVDAIGYLLLAESAT